MQHSFVWCWDWDSWGRRAEMWCWRRLVKISWGDRVRTEELLQRVKEDRTIVNTTKRRKAKWIGHILRRNYLLEHVIDGKIKGRIEVTGRQGRRGKQPLYDLKGMRGHSKLEKGALGRTLWRIRLGRDYGTVGRHMTEWINGDHNAWNNTNIRAGEKCRLNQPH
jgi:hypothetical protein